MNKDQQVFESCEAGCQGLSVEICLQSITCHGSRQHAAQQHSLLKMDSDVHVTYSLA